jgi:hypothetical protein
MTQKKIVWLDTRREQSAGKKSKRKGRKKEQIGDFIMSP